MTITQTIEIPADRRIMLEVPPQIPPGTTARYELIWFPDKKEIKNVETTIKEIQELCKDIPFSVDSFREERRRDLEIEDAKFQRFTT